MPMSGRLTPRHPLRKFMAAALLAALATGIAVGAHSLPGISVALTALDATLYDAFYRLRRTEDRQDGPIVIVTADEQTNEKLATRKIHWPYPRQLWGSAAQFVQSQGAKAIAFDLIFQEPTANDREFEKALDTIHIPLIMGTRVLDDGKPAIFAPRLAKPPTFGAVNVVDDKVVRRYIPQVAGVPSLAVRAARAAGATLPSWAGSPFLLHYYGPNNRPDASGPHLTYRYISAWAVFTAAREPAKAAANGITPDLFRGKIVLFGATGVGMYDVRSSPLAVQYPGVEVQATAIDNLLAGQRVRPVAPVLAVLAAFGAALLAAGSVILPRRIIAKVGLAFIAAAILIGGASLLFHARDIRWLPMASPLAALLLSTIGAFAWSYFTEDRQRRFVLKALSQYVSPDVASEIERDPATLKLGGQRREMTVLFSDIQGFTDLSESMDSHKLSEMLNFYLGEMSSLILANNGTLDKYIGDAIMSFWNAPAIQPDHAALACRAALAMRDREAEIQTQLAALGAPAMLTRIGINTGPMVFGNMGSPQKFNYSVLGDSVNLGSRLEGANKFYGSRILISHATALLVKDQFLLRQLDLLRVKGKLQPLAVFELMARGRGTAELQQQASLYDEALKLYHAQKWDPAIEILQSLRDRFGDKPAAALLKRIETLRHDPPPADWDGVYVAKDK